MTSFSNESVALQPTQEDTADVFRALYQNQYFTNHGPLARQFEQQLESLLHVNHAVCAGNDDLALLIALNSLGVRGSVIIPAFDAAQALRVTRWLDLQPRFCDVDRSTFQPSWQTLGHMVRGSKVVILSERFGSLCPPATVRQLVNEGLKVVRLFGGTLPDAPATEGPIPENEVHVYSFGRNSLLTTIEGGAIATDNDHLASKFRNTRSSYGMREPVQVTATCNARFSEFQAGVGLKSLAKLSEYRRHIETIVAVYRETFAASNKIEVLPAAAGEGTCIPAILTFAADQLTQGLARQGLQLPPTPSTTGSFPETNELHNHLILLPTHTTPQDAMDLSQVILKLASSF